MQSTIFSILILLNVTILSANRVLEFNEKFLDVYAKDKRSWLIMFYAPWCHHCKNLEPIWAQVAQQVHNEHQDLFVGRVDCTRFISVATHFSIKGFPTILFVNSQHAVEFRGERDKQEILDFAKRMNGPAIRRLANCRDIDAVRDELPVYFLHVGQDLPEEFVDAANKYQNLDWFYQIYDVCDGFSQGTFVVKKNKIQSKFENESSFEDWIKWQRFAQFARISKGNLNLLIRSGKYLVIALLQEHPDKTKFVNSKHQEFHNHVESIAYSFNSDNKFIFGWTSEIDTINSIAIRTMNPLPNLIVINSTNLKYFLLDSETLPQNVINLLEEIKIDSPNIEAHGGDSFRHRLLRMFFDLITSLVTMYVGNPLLTILLMGLPLTFLSVIIYASCCSDALDANEDEDSDGTSHEKRD